MALTQHTIDLINADIDGETSAAEKRELEAVLAASGEARAHYAELSELCNAMDSVEAVAPPAFLRHSILQMTASIRPHLGPRFSARRFLSAPAFRLVGAFAAGIVLGFGILSISTLPTTEFDDLTGLVGTMADGGAGPTNKNTVNIDHNDLSGTVSVHRSDQLLIVDFDLASQTPIDIVTDFPVKDVWFTGFAQQESSGTAVAAEPGRVTLRAEGRRRYALYLHDATGAETRVNLRFFADGTLIHEVPLVSDESIE